VADIVDPGDLDPDNLDPDDELLDQLSAALDATDPVPDSLMRFGVGSQRLVDFDRELAAIVGDSLLEPAATRSTGGLRTLTFESAAASVRIEIDVTSCIAHISPDPSEVVLVTPSGEAVLTASDGGLLHFDVPAEPFRLTCVCDGSPIATDWVTP